MNVFKHAKKFIKEYSAKDGGYVLVYALVIVTILTAMILGAFTIALNNMKSQQSFVEDMQKRYEAEGYVEILIATLGENVEAYSTETGTGEDAIDTTALSLARNAAISEVKDNLENAVDTAIENEYATYGVEAGSISFDDDHNTLTIPITITTADATIETELKYSVTFPATQDSWEALTDTLDPTVIVGFKYVYSAYAQLDGLTYDDFTVILN
jgi:hypothetical protein